MPFETVWKGGVDPRSGKHPGLRLNLVEHDGDMVIERDVPVRMRDGVTIFVDIFRPAGALDIPAILTWSPYGKHGLKTFAMFPNSGVPEASVSNHAVWEGPDPTYWIKQGYAIINGDVRGSWASEGDLVILGAQEAEDGYDVIEWAAQLPWCNGRVGMAGVSYLAVVQWRIASLHPPHLACINPWEGFSDTYREYAYHGGIPETNFLRFMEWSCQYSLGRVEDWVQMHSLHPMLDDYQESKSCPDLSQIHVPAYVVADWGDQGLHTRGTIEAFNSISSTDKWLEIHGRKKWQYYYQESSLVRQKSFYDCFLKDQRNEMDSWPKISIEIRNRAFVGTIRSESEWPISRTRNTALYLHGPDLSLSLDPVSEESSLRYDSTEIDDRVTLTYRFTERTELTGGMKLHLWVEPELGNDMDLFVALDKFDNKGGRVPFVAMAMLDDGPLALGWLRVSHRELDQTKSTPLRPWLTHRRRSMLELGETVPVDIEIWPSSTVFETGESLALTIQGNDIFKYDLPQVQLHQESVNRGRHIIHAGGRYDSHLLVPVVPPQ